MQITIGHYHLNPGGVTRIIESQLKSLLMTDPKMKLRVICGGWSEKRFLFPEQVELKVYPELNYLENRAYTANELDKRFQIISEILRAESELCDVLHFHNATLGKSPLISIVLYQLAKEGKKIINHAHDFAEDRPSNMAFMKDLIGDHFHLDPFDVMYPKVDTYFFGVINSSDEKRVIEYGFDKNRLHKWLNPVSVPDLPANYSKEKSRIRLVRELSLHEDKAIISYPVRVIRRKNIGEFLFLAWFFSEKANWLVTQPPNNPVEKKFYDEWVTFADEVGIEVVFEAGQKADFEDVMTGSDMCITTSIMEGFGMVFVEPWFWGTPVKGRAIPAVMADLTGSGIDFPFLYDQITVERNGALVDFASLEYEEQRETIKKYMSAGRDALHALNPELNGLLAAVKPGLVQENSVALAKSLSEKNYGRNLFELYKTIS